MSYPSEITVPWASSRLLHVRVMHDWGTPMDEKLRRFRWARAAGVEGFEVAMGLSPGTRASGVCYLADEGTTWVRGHVTADDTEGRALLAANALERT